MKTDTEADEVLASSVNAATHFTMLTSHCSKACMHGDIIRLLLVSSRVMPSLQLAFEACRLWNSLSKATSWHIHSHVQSFQALLQHNTWAQNPSWQRRAMGAGGSTKTDIGKAAATAVSAATSSAGSAVAVGAVGGGKPSTGPVHHTPSSEPSKPSGAASGGPPKGSTVSTTSSSPDTCPEYWHLDLQLWTLGDGQ